MQKQYSRLYLCRNSFLESKRNFANRDFRFGHPLQNWPATGFVHRSVRRPCATDGGPKRPLEDTAHFINNICLLIDKKLSLSGLDRYQTAFVKFVNKNSTLDVLKINIRSSHEMAVRDIRVIYVKLTTLKIKEYMSHGLDTDDYAQFPKWVREVVGFLFECDIITPTPYELKAKLSGQESKTLLKIKEGATLEFPLIAVPESYYTFQTEFRKRSGKDKNKKYAFPGPGESEFDPTKFDPTKLETYMKREYLKEFRVILRDCTPNNLVLKWIEADAEMQKAYKKAKVAILEYIETNLKELNVRANLNDDQESPDSENEYRCFYDWCKRYLDVKKTPSNLPNVMGLCTEYPLVKEISALFKPGPSKTSFAEKNFLIRLKSCLDYETTAAVTPAPAASNEPSPEDMLDGYLQQLKTEMDDNMTYIISEFTKPDTFAVAQRGE